MFNYEYEMLARFLENRIYLDISLKYLLHFKVQCVLMFALKIILKNGQKVDVTHSYVDSVVLGGIGESAMRLACRAACDFYLKRQCRLSE